MGEEYASIKTDVDFRNDIRRSFATFSFVREDKAPAETERRHRQSEVRGWGCDTKGGLEHVLGSLSTSELCGFAVVIFLTIFLRHFNRT